MINRPDSEWLARNLAQLLSLPYVEIGIPGGPEHGPVDCFSERFSELFSHDAKGIVGNTEVDKAGLKDALINMEKTFNIETSSATPLVAPNPEEIAAELSWSPVETIRVEVKAIAKTIEKGGKPRINFLQLETTQINE